MVLEDVNCWGLGESIRKALLLCTIVCAPSTISKFKKLMKEREFSFLSVGSPAACSSQAWAGSKSGARNAVQVSHMGAVIQHWSQPPAASLCLRWLQVELGAKSGILPRLSEMGCGHFHPSLNC